MNVAKEADLAGPGIGDYAELEQALPDDYQPCSPRGRRWKPSTPPSG